MSKESVEMVVRYTVFGEFGTHRAKCPQQRLKHAHQFKRTEMR